MEHIYPVSQPCTNVLNREQSPHPSLLTTPASGILAPWRPTSAGLGCILGEAVCSPGWRQTLELRGKYNFRKCFLCSPGSEWWWLLSFLENCPFAQCNYFLLKLRGTDHPSDLPLRSKATPLDLRQWTCRTVKPDNILKQPGRQKIISQEKTIIPTSDLTTIPNGSQKTVDIVLKGLRKTTNLELYSQWNDLLTTKTKHKTEHLPLTDPPREDR